MFSDVFEVAWRTIAAWFKPEASRARPSARFACLELEVLRGRIVPTVTQWTGNVSTDYFTAGNWSAGVPGFQDTAVFKDNAKDCQLAGGIGTQVGILQIESTYTGTVTVNAQWLVGTTNAVGRLESVPWMEVLAEGQARDPACGARGTEV